MYKKILFFLMLADCACRGSSIIVLSLLGELHLPVFLIVISALVALLGIGLIVKFVRHGLRLSQLALFHLCGIGATVFSLVALWFWPTDVSIIETLITGSMLTVLLNGTFLALAYHKKHYITIKQREQKQLPPPKAEEPAPPKAPPALQQEAPAPKEPQVPKKSPQKSSKKSSKKSHKK